MLALLRQRNYGLLWVGQFISMIGDWMYLVALPVFVYQLTGSALATGTMFIMMTLPRVLFGSLAGVFVDRWDRKRIMVVTDFARALVILPMVFVHSVEWVWVIYALGFLLTTVGMFYGPANNALIPHLVGEEQLAQANTLDSLGEQVTRLIGPAVGGALMASGGLVVVIVLDSVSYIVSGVLTALINAPGTKPEPTTEHAATDNALTRVWREWLAGLAVVRGDQRVSMLFVVIGLMMVGEGFIQSSLVPFVKVAFNGGAQELGLLLTSQAVGGILCSLVIGKYAQRMTAPVMIAAMTAINGFVIFGIVLSTQLWMAMVLIALAGVPVVIMSVGIFTLLQMSVQDAYRGRVFGALGTTQALVVILAITAGGFLGDYIGIHAVLALCGVFNVLAGGAALWLKAPEGKAMPAPSVVEAELA